MLNLAGITWESVVDGPGLRTVVFAQGCTHACPGCFNPELQPFHTHRSVALAEVLSGLDERPHIRGVTFSGGDPFEQTDSFARLAAACRHRGLSVWCYTGYSWETLCQCDRFRVLLRELDVLVDGPYVEAERDTALRFRGSRNQRIIDVPASLHTLQVQLWET